MKGNEVKVYVKREGVYVCIGRQAMMKRIDRYERTKRINSVRKLRGGCKESSVEERGTQGRTDIMSDSQEKGEEACVQLAIFMWDSDRSGGRTNGLGVS